jgi:hypothetical protein
VDTAQTARFGTHEHKHNTAAAPPPPATAEQVGHGRNLAQLNGEEAPTGAEIGIARASDGRRRL